MYPVSTTPRKLAASPIGRKVQEDRDRRCDICACQTNGVSSLCRRCLSRRSRFGSVKVSRIIEYREYNHFLGPVTKYLKQHPPPLPVRESMARFLLPPGKIPVGQVGHKSRALLIQEMCRWPDPRYQKKKTTHGGYDRPAKYTPTAYLATLIAVNMFIEEREGRGFPDDAEQFTLARALVRMHKRPGRRGISSKKLKLFPPGQARLEIRVNRVCKTVLAGLAARLREFQIVGVYVLTTARSLLAELQHDQAPRNAALSPRRRKVASMPQPQPQPQSQPEPEPKLKITADMLVFHYGAIPSAPAPPIVEEEPSDPGPHPAPRWDGTAAQARLINAWAKKHDRWQAFLRSQAHLLTLNNTQPPEGV